MHTYFKLSCLLFIGLVVGCAPLQQERKAFKVKSYVKVFSHVVATKCVAMKDAKESLCTEVDFISSGSGSIVHHKRKETFILTAAHVCTSELKDEIKKDFDKFSRKFRIQTSEDKFIDAELSAISPEFVDGKGVDLCLLKVSKLNLPKLHLAKEKPKLGERVYSMASPTGTYNPPAPIMASGHYSGENGNGFQSIITISHAPGSSGGPVINSRGELVGMIFAVNERLDSLTLCVKHDSIRKFFNQYLK